MKKDANANLLWVGVGDDPAANEVEYCSAVERDMGNPYFAEE